MARKTRVRSASSELAAAQLGDARLTRRLQAVANAVQAAPAKSFPEVTGSDSELEGVYRFLSNARVSAEAILEPHIRETLKRGRGRDVIAIHDTTQFKFNGSATRDGLGWIHKEGKSQGFFGHFAMAVDLANRRPLGLLGLSTHVRQGKPMTRRFSSHERYRRSGKESARWLDLAVDVHERVDVLHVMDREADFFDLFETLMRVEARFVIRVKEDRVRVGTSGRWRFELPPEQRGDSELRLHRAVTLSRRPSSGLAPRDKIHPPRTERVAKLAIRTQTLVLPRPTTTSWLVLPRTIKLTLIMIKEVRPPKGEKPISWNLLTNEAVDTDEQVERLVDAYRARWQIEEFFKALKTGCAFEKRQLESRHALENALAVFSVVAWRLLVLRAVARAAPEVPADRALTRSQLTVLQGLASLNDPRFRRVALPKKPTANDALLAVAALGGHLKNNGPPGWEVLGRGYDALLLLETGWRARDEM